MQQQPVRILSVNSQHTHDSFNHPLTLTITIQTHQTLTHPLHWQIIYVPSPEHEQYDQILEEFEISTAAAENQSILQFQVQCDAPKYEAIRRQDLIRVSALIISSSYCGQEFARIGYFVQNQLNRNIQPECEAKMTHQQLASNIKRTILIDKPRITYFNIKWAMDQLGQISSQQQTIQYSSISSIVKLQNSQGRTLVGQKQASSKTSTNSSCNKFDRQQNTRKTNRQQNMRKTNRQQYVNKKTKKTLGSNNIEKVTSYNQ